MDEKPKRRWFRFRLSTVLILTAIAAWAMACDPILVTRQTIRARDAKDSQFDRLLFSRQTREVPNRPGVYTDIVDDTWISFNKSLLWPGLALTAFLAWKAAWTIGPRIVRRRPPGLSSRG